MLIGIDIGGTNLRIGVIDGVKLIHEKRIAADFSTLCKNNPADIAWQHILNITSDAIDSVLTIYPNIQAVGIGFPGFIDPQTGCVMQSPNLPGLLNVDLAGDLSKLIQMPVLVENDALAAAFGEYKLNNISHNLIYIGLGTGVGGGLIYADQPFAGQDGFAMEVGHIIVEPNGRLCGCGNHGCLEQYASATGLSNSYHLLSGISLDADKVASLAQAGDSKAIEAFELAGVYLAQVLAHVLKTVDVTDIVIGGGLSLAWSLMEKLFYQRLNADLIPVLRGRVNVGISSSGDQAGIIGAALLAGHRLEQ
ncbi:glucokinase [Methylovorus sp. MM2]|uniref:ROK family protein n=1 Tax=Methylovorus sp. MM2 TaxID=1848038 RepID=UPI0007E13FD6|nr:ROK family protein [Methylovorus sp. MM2]OAM53059.1 glucokinase [Methylovorus sp. MM2]